MAGRRQKPFQSKVFGVVAGLARDTDGRWRILATGQKFTEPDERRAIARFRAAQSAAATVRVEIPVENETVETADGHRPTRPCTYCPDSICAFSHRNA